MYHNKCTKQHQQQKELMRMEANAGNVGIDDGKATVETSYIGLYIQLQQSHILHRIYMRRAYSMEMKLPRIPYFIV